MNYERDICCHGYERPKTSHDMYREYIKTPQCLKSKQNGVTVAQQTDTPTWNQQPIESLTRCKSNMELTRPNQSPSPQPSSCSSNQGNDFFQRYRAIQLQKQHRRNHSVIPRETLTLRPPLLNGTPIYRTGRMGASWRHMKRVTGPNGENIMFIDGTVKESDCLNYPPHGYPNLRDVSRLSRRPRTSIFRSNHHTSHTNNQQITPQLPVSLRNHSPYNRDTASGLINVDSRFSETPLFNNSVNYNKKALFA